VLPLSALWQPDYRAAYLGVNIGYVTVVESFLQVSDLAGS
jgi:hypothetical protein